jgi:hypothetical protein
MIVLTTLNKTNPAESESQYLNKAKMFYVCTLQPEKLSLNQRTRMQLAP